MTKLGRHSSSGSNSTYLEICRKSMTPYEYEKVKEKFIARRHRINSDQSCPVIQRDKNTKD